MTISWRPIALLAASSGIVIGAALVEPIAQDPLYHNFVDQRLLAGVPNFMNVMSNLPFLLVGGLGLLYVARNADAQTERMKPAWFIFFVGISLTTFGSGYYHLAPANGPLVWDRLPMTIGFMSLSAIIVAEYFSLALGKKMLLPLLVLGLASVVYWAHTESIGRGDLRPYAVVQFLPMLLIPLVILLYRSKSDLGRYIGWMIGFYLAAKIAEYFDADIYAAGNVLSGHSLKHVVAALAPASLLYGLTQRHTHDAYA